eukprot:g54995.t1
MAAYGTVDLEGARNHIPRGPRRWSPPLHYLLAGSLMLCGLSYFMTRGLSSNRAELTAWARNAARHGVHHSMGNDLPWAPSPLNAYTPFGNKKQVTEDMCMPPYPGYPECAPRVAYLLSEWNKTEENKTYYLANGVDGTYCSFLTFLNMHGLYCPEAADVRQSKIRGVNLGGWLVLEPWITPSLFEQFKPEEGYQTGTQMFKGIHDQWEFCLKLGKTEAKRQLENHWENWVTENDIKTLSEAGINHLRIPIGYWILGIYSITNHSCMAAYHTSWAVDWARKYGLYVILDLHCAPGSQNDFDNSGRTGPGIHFADAVNGTGGKLVYPNIERTLEIIRHLVAVFTSLNRGTVVGFELVNEIFVSIDINVVKNFYIEGYKVVRSFDPPLSVIIGDSFRFGNGADSCTLRNTPTSGSIHMSTTSSMTEHLDFVCKSTEPDVAFAPLSVLVGEWALATTDCTKWLNGFGTGARWEGNFKDASMKRSCAGQGDITNTTVWTMEYKRFLRAFAETQMHAYESGSSAGWFFWNFKTEGAPQWDYLLGLKEGWIPSALGSGKRVYDCENPIPGDVAP